MPSHRAERLNSDFRRELAMIITRMKDPRISPLLEVVRVKVTSDLSYAKVYIASVGGGEEAAEAHGQAHGQQDQETRNEVFDGNGGGFFRHGICYLSLVIS